MTDHKTVRQLADRFVAAVEAADAAALDAVYAPNAVVWRNYDRREQSRDENIATVVGFAQLFRSFKYAELRRHFFEGGFVQQLVASGVKASGEEFRVPVCQVITVRDNQITRIDEYFDSAQDARPPEAR